MLVALLEENRIYASLAEKGYMYLCPGCKEEVTLKKGQKVIHHFAHKPPVTCSWSKGETKEHLTAKALLRDFFIDAEGFTAEVEFPIGSCRADVYVTRQNKRPMVFEMQHTSISENEILRRTQAYFSHGIAMNWFPLINIQKTSARQLHQNELIIDCYSPKQYERWLHGFNFGEIWYFDPMTAMLWKGTFSPYVIEVPYSNWFDSDGNEHSAGGYNKYSKRWKRLNLIGPFTLNQVTFDIVKRNGNSFGGHIYPSGYSIKIRQIVNA